MSLPQSTPELTRWCALLAAIVLVIPTAIAVGSVVKAEWSGTALYSSSTSIPGIEQVTRKASPEKFKDAVLMDCFRAVLGGSLTCLSFYVYRRLSE